MSSSFVGGLTHCTESIISNVIFITLDFHPELGADVADLRDRDPKLQGAPHRLGRHPLQHPVFVTFVVGPSDTYFILSKPGTSRGWAPAPSWSDSQATSVGVRTASYTASPVVPEHDAPKSLRTAP